MKLKNLLSKLKTSTIVTIEPESCSGYYARKETVGYILDEKDKYLNLEIHEELLFISDYGIVIRIKDNSLKESEK